MSPDLPVRPAHHTGTSPTGVSLQVVVMGVSATGKSTVAAAVAADRGWDLVEGDDLHPASNVAKMQSGEPLTDEDRAPWLDRVNERARGHAGAGHSAVITCSALKRSYRDRLRVGVPTMFFLHLHGAYEVLEPRMAQRQRHFMPTGLLRSQFDTLEPLAEDEDGVVVDVAASLQEVVADARAAVAERLRR
jgi:gluconokinase